MGIDYGNGITNTSDTLLVQPEQLPQPTARRYRNNRIRYGVISQHDVGSAWYEDSEAYYGKPHCPECGTELDQDACDGHECDCGYEIEHIGEECYGDEPNSHYYKGEGYEAEAGCEGDIFITKSRFYTLCDFCSPCAPGAGYLTSRGDDCAAFCFGPDWFDGKPPYDVYRVSDGSLVCEGKDDNA